MQTRKPCPVEPLPDLAARASEGGLNQALAECLNHPLTRVILESVDGYCLILNQERQLLDGNQELLNALNLETPHCMQGLRPGEVFNCIHAHESPDGCGNSESCARCGALLTLLVAQRSGEASEGECTLSFLQEGQWVAREFHVRVNPIQVGSHPLLIFVLRDVSSEKRRENLEKIFLHDLLNTLQGLRGWTELLQFPSTDPQVAAKHIYQLSDQLTQEVVAQRLLVQAERGELKPDFEELSVEKLFKELDERLALHCCRTGKRLLVRMDPEGLQVRSDPVVLQRVLFNMLINALEATPKGGEVSLSASLTAEGWVGFEVHNAGWIAEDVATRVFQRSFSTKGDKGRGLGTYGMKLLGENVLKGKVSFSTSRERGTSFVFVMPERAEP